MRWLGLLIVLGLVAPTGATAQKAGLVPSRDLFEPSESALPIDAFLFLSESGSQVVVPGTTWEQLEKLKQLENGSQPDRNRYVFQSLKIVGSTKNGRAQMDVTIQLNIEPTEGRFVKIPLRMSNFHRLGTEEVTGVDEHAMVVSGNGQGYQWWVRTDKACKAKLKMKVSARVETIPADSLRFDLPDVPAKVTLTVDAEDVAGDVVSGSDEVVTSKPFKMKSTRLLVESNGGDFLLRWRSRRNIAQQKPLLEVESRVDVRWDSPQDQPIASIRLTARNVKGAIERFQLLMPPGAVLLDVPRLGIGGQSIQFVPMESESDKTSDKLGDLVEVILPEEERQQRIDLNFELQLSGGEISAETPLVLTVPQVVDSLRHRGEFSVRSGDEYRLRWETRPWVRSELADEADQASGGRTYRFRFDRGSFELPIWLSAKERRLSLSVQSEVVIRDATASLQMQITVGGSVVNNMLRIDDASWEVLSIVNQETGQRVETFLVGDERVMQWSQESRQDDLVFLLSAQRPLGQDLGDIEFPLPSISTSENEVVAGESTMDLVGNGRTLMTVDMAASEGLTRVMTSVSENASGATVSRFQVARFGEPVNVVGTLQNQPLRLTLAPNATVEIDGSQILSTIDWTIDSPLDLEGRLPIRIPNPFRPGQPTLGQLGPRQPPTSQSRTGQSTLDPLVDLSRSDNAGLNPTADDVSPSDPSEGSGASVAPVGSPFDSSSAFGSPVLSAAGDGADAEDAWVVTVDGVPAVLRKLENDRFELISERLASGTMSIRWRHEQDISSSDSARNIQQVVFPRPQIPDVTMRGIFEIALRGDGKSELIASDTIGAPPEAAGRRLKNSDISETQFLPFRDATSEPSTRSLTLDTLPRGPIRLQLRARASDLQQLSVDQVVLRTAIGHQTRQEQVLANIRRGSEFRVHLTNSAFHDNGTLNQRNERLAKQVRVEAFVDGEVVSVENRQGWLVIDLPGDLDRHTLEMNLWIPQETTSSFSKVRPLIQLPSGLGRVFWQVIAPLDSHVVWASPTVGRAMSWKFDQWRLYRQSSLNDRELSNLVGSPNAAMPPGNRYLYVGTDFPAFEAAIASRTMLWLIVASTVLLASVLLMYIPVVRNPLSAVIAALLFAGLILIAPDAAVLAGQLGLISLVLVIVMYSIRSLLIPGRNDRVFATTSQSNIGTSSTRIVTGGVTENPASSNPGRGGISETESVRPPNDLSSSGAEIAS